MRLRRLSFVAGWAAVALLAIAGFAAFRPDRQALDALAQEGATGLGHATGAYAGLTFALLAGVLEDDGQPDAVLSLRTEPTTESAPAGTITADSSGWLSQVQVRELVSRYFAAEDVNRAVRVAWCESRFNPSATDLRTGAVGLFRHLPQYWSERAAQAGFGGAAPTDPEASTAAAAWAVYHEGGWDTFACGTG